mmetsp:Transcript_13171/g.20081  ORF Transcript_13171/g.20081 Transcript_13171/m.20081 type:complete len:179 (-) Transcript_13171:557-1093(-)
MKLVTLLCVVPIGCFAFLLENKENGVNALDCLKSTTVCDKTRRTFFLSILTANTLSQPARAQPAPSATLDFTYAKFKRMLESNEITSVTFSYDGKSMVCVDQKEIRRALFDIPDDPSLLSDLYKRKIDVIVDEYKSKKNLDTARWIMDKVGGDVSDAAGVYRGYKTQRQSVPGTYLPW